MAEGTVWSEPVSGSPISLLDGNLQGNWAISRQVRPPGPADPEGFRRLGPKFPNQLSRDFPIHEQRIPWADQRATFFDHGIGLLASISALGAASREGKTPLLC
jgi:hypothetical protein